ncbi:hypothetical protein, partial [Streptomyces galbus]|uniref:hypothetical protein n=1 Tax=Streptomyces galbus TaxID=33898 RepID=UPI001B3242F0
MTSLTGVADAAAVDGPPPAAHGSYTHLTQPEKQSADIFAGAAAITKRKLDNYSAEALTHAGKSDATLAIM